MLDVFQTGGAVLPEDYSRGVGEYESEDCGDGFWEGFRWSSVAGVQDSPGLDVGDDSFDLVADLACETPASRAGSAHRRRP